jgi:predicted Zn-dependent peptidase
MDELKRAADDMSEAEVNRARVQLKAGMLMGLESPSSRAERNARLLAIWGRVPDVDETVAKIDAVSTEAVRRYGAEMVQSKAAMALYGPVGDAPDLEAVRARLAA